MSAPKSHEFKAEVSQVLHLVVNSLYTKKEIFLRELISNASDAIDKRRFLALTEPALAVNEPKISLTPDEAQGTLTISDSGIGMTEDELVSHLGTIARSGTKEFSQKLSGTEGPNKDLAALIGQFGVGFYSAFLVADRVEVISRSAHGGPASKWASDAQAAFTIEPAERAEPGTTIVLHLKADERDYLKPWRLKEVVRQHSDYVGHPIELWGPAEPPADPKPEVINQARALWQQNPKELTEEQYAEFYKHLAHDWEAPLAHRHFRIEGTQQFAGIVYIPKKSRSDLMDPRGEHGVRLHVRRVLAMESCEELLPRWLRFVRGVVDSEDLPLNVSRETLQDSKAIKIIRKQVVSQILSALETLKSERLDDYLGFWKQFGAALKEGFYFDPDLKDRLAEIVLYASTHDASEGALTSLSDYVGRMKDGQPGIYYVEGSGVRLLQKSPHLERLAERGYEVLLMADSVDTFALEKFTEYQGKKFLNAAQADVDLGDKDESAPPEADPLTDKLQGLLAGKVSKVRNSRRLKGSPACLVTADGGLPPHMVAMFRAQNVPIPDAKRILEVNPDHPLIQNLRKLQILNDASPDLAGWAEVLYDQALLSEGSAPEDPVALAGRLTQLLEKASASAIA